MLSERLVQIKISTDQESDNGECLIFNLPNEILNDIMYAYLNPREIESCLYASKKFHVFTQNQIRIINNANLGWYHCLHSGLVRELKCKPYF